MIKYRSAILPSGKLTVSVSGGVDSIAACYFLLSKRDIEVFHFNHKLRLQNDQMQLIVESFCSDHNINLIISDRSDNIVQSESIEAQAREWRHKAIKYHSLKSVILAHHLDDAIENYFMNFLRGCPQHRPIPISTSLSSITSIYRPFLLTRKQDFIDYADKHNLMHYVVEDETQSDMAIRRNWVRKSILPAIRERYQGLPKIVSKKVIKAYSEFSSSPHEDTVQ